MSPLSKIQDLLKEWSNMINQIGVEGRVAISIDMPLRLTHADGRTFQTWLPVILTGDGVTIPNKDKELELITQSAIKFFHD